MTADEYRAALAALGLTQAEAGAWLGVSLRTAKAYATQGPTNPAARAIRTLLQMTAPQRAAALKSEI